MSTWKLNINGTERTLSALGISSLDLQLFNLGEDTLGLTAVPTALNANQPLAYGDTIKLIENTTVRYIGTVVTSPRIGMPGRREAVAYTAKNVLWQLNRMIYEQDWHLDETNTYYKGRVTLGKDATDTRITIGEAIKDVLDFAINAGLSFSYVQADLDALTTTPPDSEFVDITCFEAIKNLLNWSPAVATEVDYSSGTPSIRFISRADATAAAINSSALRSLSITPRNDIKIDGVVVNYEILNQVDGETYTNTVQDTAGTTTGLNVLKQTIDLYGTEASYTEQSIDVVVGPGPASYTDLSWWSSYVPGLSLITDAKISDGQLIGSGYSVLLSGSVPEWTNETAQEYELTANVSGSLNGSPFSNIPISVNLVRTTAETKTYTQLTSVSYTPPEDIPTGLAAAILADRSVLHYEGQFSILSAEPDWSLTTAKVCNITAPASTEIWDGAVWEDSTVLEDNATGFEGLDNINAVVESIRISRGPTGCTTTVAIGPPRHLQAQDFIALARASRTRAPSEWSRSEPSDKTTGKVALSGLTPNTNGNMLGGATLPSTVGKTVGMNLRIKTVATESVAPEFEWDFDKWSDSAP